jgi:hypothetical protein
MKAKVKTWLAQLESGAIKSKTVKILNYIKRNTEQNRFVSLVDMRENLGISHQSLTGILSTLCDEGLLFSESEIEYAGKYYSQFLYVSNEQTRKELRAQRLQEKFTHWLNRVDEFEELIPSYLIEQLKQINSNN